jgi:hypothetical protein
VLKLLHDVGGEVQTKTRTAPNDVREHEDHSLVDVLTINYRLGIPDLMRQRIEDSPFNCKSNVIHEAPTC